MKTGVCGFVLLLVLVLSITTIVFIPRMVADTLVDPLQIGTWQLREFKRLSYTYPEVSFALPEDSVLRVNSSYESDGASAYAFIKARRSDLHGKKIQVRWNLFYTAIDSRDLQLLSLYVFDKPFNRTNMDDYFKEDLDREPMFDYTNILCTYYPGPLGAPLGWLGWRTDISGILDLTPWVSDYVTILIRLVDGWSGQSVVGDLDWVKILDATPNVVHSFDFSGSVQMEVSGTYHDYGLFVPILPKIILAPTVCSFWSATMHIGDRFNVTVYVQNVTSIGGAQVYLEFNDSILQVSRWFEPKDDSEYIFYGKSTMPLPTPPDPSYLHLGPNRGRVKVSVSLFPGEIQYFSGSGKVCVLEFNITSIPTEPGKLTSNLLLSSDDTFLLDGETGEKVLDVTKEDGRYELNYGGFHDITVSNVTVSKTVVGQGCTVNLDADLENLGVYEETFGITAFANTTVIQVASITLAGKQSCVVTFSWNTSLFALGNYNISVAADVIPEDVNIDNNRFEDGKVTVSIVGDVNADRKVDLMDVYAVAKAYGTSLGDPRYKPNLDINGDLRIDLKDYYMTCKNYGHEW